MKKATLSRKDILLRREEVAEIVREEEILNPPSPVLNYRLFGGGYWFQGVNAWGHRKHAQVYHGKGDPRLLQAQKDYPNTWPIADRVEGEPPKHCEWPRCCSGPKRQPNGACSCGCDDCNEIAVALGSRPY